MKINKKFLQTFAAILILMFHTWIIFTNSRIETYIIRIGYIGVDLFFFLSAYSLADKEIDYFSFIKNRFSIIYVKYFFYIIIASVFFKWKFKKFISLLFFVEFFKRGGGAFLWFVNAILIFYLIYPLFIRWKCKYKYIIVLTVWFILSYILEKYLGYNKIFIFTNRIPVILVGDFYKKNKTNPIFNIMMLPLGMLLLYKFGFEYKLNIPLNSFFYLTAIPAIVGMVQLGSYVPECKVINYLGKATLEMYAISMIFGPKLIIKLYNLMNNPLLTNITVFIVILTASILLERIFSYIYSKLNDLVIDKIGKN